RLHSFFFYCPTPHDSSTLSLHDALPICDVIPLSVSEVEEHRLVVALEPDVEPVGLRVGSRLQLGDERLAASLRYLAEDQVVGVRLLLVGEVDTGEHGVEHPPSLHDHRDVGRLEVPL